MKDAVERFMAGEAVLASELPPFRWDSKSFGTDHILGYDCEYHTSKESFTVHHFIDPFPGEPDIWFMELLSGVPQFEEDPESIQSWREEQLNNKARR